MKWFLLNWPNRMWSDTGSKKRNKSTVHQLQQVTWPSWRFPEHTADLSPVVCSPSDSEWQAAAPQTGSSCIRHICAANVCRTLTEPNVPMSLTAASGWTTQQSRNMTLLLKDEHWLLPHSKDSLCIIKLKTVFFHVNNIFIFLRGHNVVYLQCNAVHDSREVHKGFYM